MLLNFRKAEAKDIASMYEIELLSFRDPYSLDFILELYASQLYEVFAAEEGSTEKIVAYAIIGLDTREKKALHIVSFAVHPGARRGKIGTKLLDFLVGNYRERGATLFWLEVRESNIAAIEFYRKNGFSEIGRAKNYYGEEDAIILIKYL